MIFTTEVRDHRAGPDGRKGLGSCPVPPLSPPTPVSSVLSVVREANSRSAWDPQRRLAENRDAGVDMSRTRRRQRHQA